MKEPGAALNMHRAPDTLTVGVRGLQRVSCRHTTRSAASPILSQLSNRQASSLVVAETWSGFGLIHFFRVIMSMIFTIAR